MLSPNERSDCEVAAVPTLELSAVEQRLERPDAVADDIFCDSRGILSFKFWSAGNGCRS